MGMSGAAIDSNCFVRIGSLCEYTNYIKIYLLIRRVFPVLLSCGDDDTGLRGPGREKRVDSAGYFGFRA